MSVTRDTVTLRRRSPGGRYQEVLVDRRWFHRQLDIELDRLSPENAALVLRPWLDGDREPTEAEWDALLGMLARIANRARWDPEAHPRH